jgi:catechol 2,3-dioxygenase-like lactoylglutathione lyase family enzyme
MTIHPNIDQQVTFLYCHDLVKTAKFYEQVIGFELVLDQGGCRIYRVCEDSFLGFCQRVGIRPNPEGIVYTFVTEDVNGWYEFLKGRGVDLVKAPEENPTYNIYHFFFRDPNGYMLEVQKFLDPRWPKKGGKA